jgi:hypothetical protein
LEIAGMVNLASFAVIAATSLLTSWIQDLLQLNDSGASYTRQ